MKKKNKQTIGYESRVIWLGMEDAVDYIYSNSQSGSKSLLLQYLKRLDFAIRVHYAKAHEALNRP